jgi:molecular chaperone GrpE (heat shock protein)
MIHDLIGKFTLWQLALIPLLIIVILVLLVIIIILVLQLQRLRSSQWSQPVVYSNPMYQPPKIEHKEEEVKRQSQTDIAKPSPFSQLIRTDSVDRSDDEHWLKLVEECVLLYNDLDQRIASFNPERKELAEHILLQLQEILERSGVELITEDTIFERRRHQAVQPASKAIPGTPIVETLSPGFAVGRHVLRRARVRLAQVPLEGANNG